MKVTYDFKTLPLRHKIKKEGKYQISRSPLNPPWWEIPLGLVVGIILSVLVAVILSSL